MARRNRTPQRDASALDQSSLTDPLLRELSPFEEALPPLLNEISDARLWHPDPPGRRSLSTRSAPTTFELVDRQPSPRQVARGLRVFSQTKAVLAFEQPDQAIHCVRRKTRREVLFAKRGLNGRAKRRRHWHSNVRC